MGLTTLNLRFATAYRPHNDPSTALRAGWGFVHDSTRLCEGGTTEAICTGEVTIMIVNRMMSLPRPIGLAMTRLPRCARKDVYAHVAVVFAKERP